METTQIILPETRLNDPKVYIDLGNEAGKTGNMEASVKWYMKGLTLAKEIRDTQSSNKLSALIALSL